MTNGKLYGSPKSPRTQKVLIAAKYGGTDVALVTDSAPADLSHFGLDVVFVDGDNRFIGCLAAALHVGGDAVKGQFPAHFARVLQYLEWSESKLSPSVLGYVLPSVSAMQVDKKVFKEAKDELFALLHTLNDHLLGRTYLVDERISLADISVALDLLPAYQYVLDGSARANLKNLNRWFQTVVNQPHVKSIIGEVQLCQEVCQFDGKKHKELSGSKATKEAHVEHPAEHDAKPAASATPKGEKASGKKHGKKEKEHAPAAEHHDAAEEPDDTEEAMAMEPKAVDPFAGLPKGTFDLDAFKRVYSNEDTLTKAIPHFWQNFDPQQYSIWFSEYKYPEELTLIFMSCNLINGMYQRLEKLKKNAFASVCLFGEDNHSTISGVWVWRGHDLVFTLSPDWQIDYESYSWTKLDPDAEATKTIVKEYFAWEGDFGGKKFNQGKIFK
jgi:elongation factor 1-gamma